MTSINRFILANFITYLGSGIQILGAAYVSFLETRSIFSIGGVFLVYAFPQIISSYYTHALITKFGEKFICVWSDYLRAAVMGVLALAVYFEIYVLALVYLATLLGSILDSYYVPSSNSFFQKIVSKSSQSTTKSSSRLETSIQIAMLFSVSLGALLADTLGTYLVFAINSVSFLFSGLILTTIIFKKKETQEKTIANSSHLYTYLNCLKEHGSVVINFSLARTIPSVMNTVTIYFVVETLSRSFFTLGLVDAIASIGFALGAICYPTLERIFTPKKVMYISLISTSFFIFLQPLHDLTFMGVTFFIATLMFGISRVAARATIMNSYDDQESEIIYATANIVGIFNAFILTIVVCYAEVYFDIRIAYALVASYLVFASIYSAKQVKEIVVPG